MEITTTTIEIVVVNIAYSCILKKKRNPQLETDMFLKP